MEEELRYDGAFYQGNEKDLELKCGDGYSVSRMYKPP